MAERKEVAIVNELAHLLRKNGDKILSGESKLTLTTQSLSCMNVAFRRYSESGGSNWDAPQQPRDERRKDVQQMWRTNVQFLHDFITKTVSLKVTHGSQTMQGPIFISRFRGLREIELRKIPMHMLEGLHKLRVQLRVVIASRCLQNVQVKDNEGMLSDCDIASTSKYQFQVGIMLLFLGTAVDLLETCGGDQSSPMSWPNLTSLYLSYNDISRLDPSLRLTPNLEILDLSHNSIEKPENLEYLTQLTRLSLGYNFLDSIPILALSVRPRLKTLIIRNNNLDNLEGVSEFVNLEELDLSENCICEHACLETLSSLHKISMLGLSGNPLAFHKNHRSLTLSYLSQLAVRNGVILDGKRATTTEMAAGQSLSVTHSRRPSTVSAGDPTTSESSSNRISLAYSFADSDNIATSVKVGSPSKKKVRRKKSRSRSKAADDVDSGLCQSVTSGTEISSAENSRAPSPERVIEGQVSSRSTKEEIEVLRDHYGVNWLQVMATRSTLDGLSDESASPKPSPKSTYQTIDVEVHTTKTSKHTEDDLYLNDSTTGIHGNSSDAALGNHGSSSHDNEDDIEVLSEPEKGTSLPTSSSGEIYRVVSPVSSGSSSSRVYQRMDSSKGAEWERDSTEQEMFYGAESEPFIMMLLHDNLRQLFVSTNQRYLIEKNLEGHEIEMLDLKCLLVANRKEEEITHANLVEGTVLPVLRLKFDYMKKDRRERVYVMESTQCADDFEELLTPFIQARDLEERMKGMLQCLKCSAQFHKDDAIKTSNTGFNTIYGGDTDTVKYSCPQCNSDMVLELDLQQNPDSRQCTPIGSLPSSVLDPTNSSPTQLYSSPVAKSTPLRKTSLNKQDTQSDVAMSPARHRSNAFSETMTRSDGISSHVENSDSALPKSHSTGHNIDRLKDVPSETTPSDFQRNISWSDVRQGTSRMNSTDSDISIITNESRKEGKRSSRMNSAESDISILNSEGSSITVISTSSAEGILEQNAATGYDSQSTPILVNTAGVQITPTVPSTGMLLKGISEEGDSTPFGSPLSNSVCSSMVSSVYENSLTANSSENLASERNESVTALENGSQKTNKDEDVWNNNEDHGSIYDTPSIYDSQQGKTQSTELSSHTICDHTCKSNSDVKSEGSSVNVISDTSDSAVENQKDDMDNLSTTANSNVLQIHTEESVSEDMMHSDSQNSLSVSEAILNGTWLPSCDESCDVDFTKIDHKLKLYLVMHVLEDEEEEIEYAVKCDIVQYLKMEPYNGYLVFSTHRILVLESVDNSESAETGMSCVENQPITELQYIDIGLGYQSFRFEFDTECSSFTFCIRDEGHCKQMITAITNIIQKTASSHESRLEGISKYNAESMGNLQDIVWSPWKQNLTEEDEEFHLVKYLSGILYDIDTCEHRPVGLAVMPENLCLVKENHQWPLPRLQAPLSDEIKGQQFQLIDHQSINNIATVEVCKDTGTKVRITFFNEESQNEAVWYISMVTASGIKALINAVKETWEAEFGVEMDISPVDLEF